MNVETAVRKPTINHVANQKGQFLVFVSPAFHPDEDNPEAEVPQENPNPLLGNKGCFVTREGPLGADQMARNCAAHAREYAIRRNEKHIWFVGRVYNDQGVCVYTSPLSDNC